MSEKITDEEVPVWLTTAFLRDLLQISGDLKLKSVQYACKKGENFASKIYRAEIECDIGLKSVIVKSRPFENNGFSEEFLKKFNVFGKEIETYKLVEKFENILTNCAINEEDEAVCFAPRCLKVTAIPTDILIIEDFCAKGFEVAPKAIGLDLEKMRVTLRKLAQFHASSAIYYETHGHFDEKYSRGVYNAEMASIFDQHYDYNFTFILDEFFSTWPNLDIKIIDKMRNWRKFILKELIRTMKPNPLDEFNCLNHGDCWISNILFCNDENGNVKDCAFIDFQQCVYTSPAVDLLTLIITSADIKTKVQNFDFYIKFYHENLVRTLKCLNYEKKIPTLKELYMDVIDRAFLAVWNSFCMLPACLVEERVEESSCDNLLGSNEEGQNYKKKLYNNERYRKHMTELLTFFDNRGLVDLC